MAKHSEADKQRAKELLQRCFPKGATVYTIIRHVARSGMSRTIAVKSITAEGDGTLTILEPNWATSVLLGWSDDRANEGVKVQGAGMDMGFHLAYSLGQVLYDDGYALKHRWL